MPFLSLQMGIGKASTNFSPSGDHIKLKSAANLVLKLVGEQKSYGRPRQINPYEFQYTTCRGNR
jgi:hypothetical protein